MFVTKSECIARDGLVLPAKLCRKVLPHLFDGFRGRKVVFSLAAIEAPDDSLREVFEGF
jgi:hypothetical protein